MEISLIIAFLHYWIGVSLDNVLQILAFFTGLPLSKSQADSLLTQLATDWDEQYDTTAELLALQLIVCIDETGWRVGNRARYTWVFSTTTMYVLFRCGLSRQQSEATTILGDSFNGIGVTDDYGAYKHWFSQHQLCWTHLLRKAIKLALQHPDEPAYATFLDQLCGIYDDARQLRNAERLAPAAPEARQEQVAELQGRIQALCPRHAEPICKDEPPDHEATFIRLQRELVTNLECLFVFVQHPAVEPTNNRNERHLRREAEIRKGARTSKSKAGAKRRSVIMTVLASLQLRISTFTLSAVLTEVNRGGSPLARPSSSKSCPTCRPTPHLWNRWANRMPTPGRPNHSLPRLCSKIDSYLQKAQLLSAVLAQDKYLDRPQPNCHASLQRGWCDSTVVGKRQPQNPGHPVFVFG